LTNSIQGKFVNRLWHQAPCVGASEAADRYINDGWKACTVSNQGSVAASHKSLESAIL
jgi:hypothetical protein